MLARGVLLGLAVMVLPVAPAAALTVTYEAIDLADSVPGEDLWQYAWTLDEFPFGADHSLTVLFDATHYADLESPPPPVNADWDPLVLQPDLLLAAPGAYDALALSATPSLADPFVVSFVWLGAPGTTPGPQPFEIREFNSSGLFLGVRESGTTVPEPTTGLLVLLGLATVAARRTR